MPTFTVSAALDLALQHHQAGRLSEAEALYRQVLTAEPHHADAWHFLGVIAHQNGDHDLAVQRISQAIAVNPNYGAAYCNLAEAHRAAGRRDEAMAAYLRSLELEPNSPETLNNFGNALREQGQLDEAVAAYRRVLALQPNHFAAHSNLGVALDQLGQLDDAITECRRAIELRPDFARAHYNLGVALGKSGQLDEAVAAYRGALELQPGFVEAHTNLASVLKDQGQLDDAIAGFRRALQSMPTNPLLHSNLIYTLHFHPGFDERVISEEQARWNWQFGVPVGSSITPLTNDRNAGRRLRIGYVSVDFWDHVAGRNLLPLFQHHDHEKFEVLCYSGRTRADHLTEEFHLLADHWRNIAGVPDEQVASTIRHDGVDILVDLSQHTAGNRLPIFAHHPAPAQLSFAGYPARTGLEAIEYRISDQYLESASKSSTDHVHLIDSFWCYDPCGIEVPINELPAAKNGSVTFGSLNNFCKINEPVLQLWARVLGNVPQSRLILLAQVGSHRQRTLEILARAGVDADRIEFVEPRPRRAYLELYHRLDIVLDPFPYNGHTTSLDALWMGVPVVSLAGPTSVSRAGLSQLSNLGLPELAALVQDEYVRIATDLAANLPRLTHLRATLRPRMQASVLMDAPRFARNIEAAYRAIWQQLCAERPS